MAHELLDLLGGERLGGAATMGDAQVGHFFERVGGKPVLEKGELEKGEQDAPAVVESLGAGVAALAMDGETLAGKLGEGLVRKMLFQRLQLKPDVLELAGGEQSARVLLALGSEVGSGRVTDADLALRGAVVGEGVFEIERERLGRADEAAERSLGLAELIVGQKCRSAADVAGGLRGLCFKGGHFGTGLFAGFEVLTEAEAVEPTGDSP